MNSGGGGSYTDFLLLDNTSFWSFMAEEKFIYNLFVFSSNGLYNLYNALYWFFVRY